MNYPVSIITITYNAEKFLEKTIQSILNQNNPNFEYLIIDGASKDRTADIIKKYEQKCPNLKWISEPDKGLYDAMNKGMHLATGDFVWFINAGDKLYDNNTVQTVIDTIEAHPNCDVVYGQSLIIDEEDKPLGERHKIAPKILTKKSLLNGLVVCHQSIVVRKAIAPDYDLQYRISADYDWTCKVLTQSKENCYIDHYISRFMVAGVSSRQRKKSWLERFKIMKKHFGLCVTLWHHFLIILRYPFTTKW